MCSRGKIYLSLKIVLTLSTDKKIFLSLAKYSEKSCICAIEIFAQINYIIEK